MRVLLLFALLAALPAVTSYVFFTQWGTTLGEWHPLWLLVLANLAAIVLVTVWMVRAPRAPRSARAHRRRRRRWLADMQDDLAGQPPRRSGADPGE